MMAKLKEVGGGNKEYDFATEGSWSGSGYYLRLFRPKPPPCVDQDGR